MSPRSYPEINRSTRLRSLRESQGLTQLELGKFTGYSERQVARWEAGESEVREAVVQYLLSLDSGRKSPSDGAFRFIDLFAGIGGFRMGFEAVGGSCVYTSEWDRFAQTTYRANFGEHELHGDITQVDAEEIPDHEVLLAGFPCQPFSIAGVSKKNALGRKHGFECDTQGTLFFDLERIIGEKQPRAFVLENVKNLASHDGGKTFDVIKRTLRDKLGYRIAWNIVDAARFLPQHRERVFIVGLHPDLKAHFDWSAVHLPPVAGGPRLGEILHSEDGSEELEEAFLDAKGRVHKKYVLSDHLWNYLQSYARKHQEKGNGFGFGIVGPDDVARTLSARYYKDGSEILIRRKKGPPRRLTPRECARLMGFDRAGHPPYKIVVSDTQAYKQFGNSVAVPVVQAVATALRPYVAAASATSVRGRKRATAGAA
jgi:DNA (cytosine-5)-methyltransferase 1